MAQSPVIAPVLLVAGAVKRYRRVTALAGVTCDVCPGEVVGIVGPNGAGKTTLLRAAAGLVPLDEGLIVVSGTRPGGPAARRAVGYAPAAPAFPPALSVRDVLEYVARLHAAPGHRPGLVARALEIGRLEAVASQRATRLSHGYAQRLALALAVMGERRLLLLDETLAGVDPATRRELAEQLRALAGTGTAIVLATHDLATLERLATRVVVLHRGRLVREASLTTLLGERVLEVVLDGAAAAVRPPLPGARQTAAGFEVDLGPGQAPEEILALCRAHRLSVRATAVRCKSLEDALLDTLRDR